MSAMRILAADEFRTAFRGPLVVGFASLFTLLALGISLAGLGASGSLLFQGYLRTAVSLLNLALYLMPLLGLLAGSIAFAASRGELELLLAQPIARGEVLAGRAIGLAAAVAVAIVAGFTAPGIMVAVLAGPSGLPAFVLAATGSLFVGLVALEFGILIGVHARSRGTAVAHAIAVWLVAVVLYDLGAITLLQVAGDGGAGPVLLAILALNPLDAVRTLLSVELGAETLMGPSGAALRRLLSGAGPSMVGAAALVAWLAVPALVTWRKFNRRDF
jgi:Cu-processing system permease protein